MLELTCIIKKGNSLECKTDGEILSSLSNYIYITNNFINKINQNMGKKNEFNLVLKCEDIGLWNEQLCDGIVDIIENCFNLGCIKIYTDTAIFQQPWIYKLKQASFYHTYILNDKPEKLPEIKDYDITYVIEVFKQSIIYLNEFISINKDKKIVINPNKSVDILQYQYLIDIIKLYPNIDKNNFLSLLTLKNQYQNNTLQDTLSICKQQKLFVTIDINENRIRPCCNSSMSFILNSDNYYDYLHHKLFDRINCGECNIPAFYYYTTKEK